MDVLSNVPFLKEVSISWKSELEELLRFGLLLKDTSAVLMLVETEEFKPGFQLRQFPQPASLNLLGAMLLYSAL